MSFPDWAVYVLVSIGSYLIGSIPFGFIIGKVIKGIDIRNYGSGNIGFSNVFRILGKAPGYLALFCDVFVKGFFLAYAIRLTIGFLVIPGNPQTFIDFYTLGYTELVPQIITTLAGLLSIIGHNWPIYLLFRGGKGMATTAGIFLCFVPLSTLFLVIVWLICLKTTKMTSLSNLITMPIAAFIMPLETVLLMKVIWYPLSIGGFLAAVMVYITHHENIARLLKGEERRFGDKSERIENQE
jgi:glycerol-3-phosphate acyltransferase PlsY